MVHAGVLRRWNVDSGDHLSKYSEHLSAEVVLFLGQVLLLELLFELRQSLLLLGLLLFVLLDPALVVHLDLVVACIRLR